MRKTYRVLAGLLVLEVLVQAMAIAYALAGLSHWVREDGGVLSEAAIENEVEFAGVGGFMLHGMNGMMVIPLLALLLLLVSFFARVPGGVKRALVLVGLVALQIVLGVTSGDVPGLAALHALNAFAIATVAFLAARSARATTAPAVAHDPERVPV